MQEISNSDLLVQNKAASTGLTLPVQVVTVKL